MQCDWPGACLPSARRNVHDLHVWQIGFPALSAHVLVAPSDDCHAVRRELETLLAPEFGISHTTLQVEHETARRLLTTAETRTRQGGRSRPPRRVLPQDFERACTAPAGKSQ